MLRDETEKHNQIMTAAAALFAKQGYKKTTVDEIVAGAGISKGLFYHYFKNKQDLYVHLYNSYVDILSNTILQKVDLSEADFFLRLKQFAYIRLDFILKYPNLWQFLYSAYFESHTDVEPLIREKNNTLLKNAYSGSAAGIDWSKLKKGITPDKAIEIVTWLAEGFMRKISESGSIPNEEAINQFDEYMECLKNGLYESRKG